MIPVIQTVHTKEDGNCLAACLASVLEIGIETFPDLPKGNGKWIKIIKDHLHGIGYNLILIDDIHEESIHGYYLMVGDNPTSGHQHCVVCRGGEVVHDPSPKRDTDSPPLQKAYYIIISKIL